VHVSGVFQFIWRYIDAVEKSDCFGGLGSVEHWQHCCRWRRQLVEEVETVAVEDDGVDGECAEVMRQ